MIDLSKDTTISFRGSDELKEKVALLIENSGLTQKEWYEKAISLADMQTLKEGARDYSADLSELEMHTQRIYELIGNMVKRAGYEKDSVERKLDEVKASQNEVISEYQQKLKVEIELRQEAEEQTKTSIENEGKLSDQLFQLQKANTNNESLIEEYKGKIDTLSSLVAEYQAYATENKQLQADMRDLKEKNRSSIEEMKVTVKGVTGQLEQAKTELNTTEKEKDRALETLTDKLGFEKDKVLLEADKKHQVDLTAASEKYNDKILELYESIEEMRRSNDNKVSRLEKTLEESASKHSSELAKQKAYYEIELEKLKEG